MTKKRKVIKIVAKIQERFPDFPKKRVIIAIHL